MSKLTDSQLRPEAAMSPRWDAARADLQVRVMCAVRRFENETGWGVVVEMKFEQPDAPTRSHQDGGQARTPRRHEIAAPTGED